MNEHSGVPLQDDPYQTPAARVATGKTLPSRIRLLNAIIFFLCALPLATIAAGMFRSNLTSSPKVTMEKYDDPLLAASVLGCAGVLFGAGLLLILLRRRAFEGFLFAAVCLAALTTFAHEWHATQSAWMVGLPLAALHAYRLRQRGYLR